MGLLRLPLPIEKWFSESANKTTGDAARRGGTSPIQMYDRIDHSFRAAAKIARVSTRSLLLEGR
jgi:hypothetical protein